ncbi:hypothetical protein LPJ56_001592 [Coemansia sp. RSA 2599]|nr:hypothetical protein LPJ56_001592 [Coemansia sp. RSA 2599]
MPTLRHRSGGVNTGRTSEDGGATPASRKPPAAAPPPPPQSQPEQKTDGGSRFALPFRRNSHGRSSSQADTSSAASEPARLAPVPPQPPQLPFNGLSALSGRRTSDAGAGLPPLSSPASRPASSLSAKKPPPPPPSSRKPQIRPKPQGLGASRLASQSTSASPAMNSTPDLRGTLRPAAASSPVNARPSAEENNGSSSIIAESQGSVSSLAGMFGQRVKVGAGHNRTLTGNTFNAPQQQQQQPPPPPPTTSSMHGGSFAHQRTGSTQAPGHPPPSLPRRTSGAGGTDASSGVPVREGKWTFHALADLPPPPPQPNMGRHVYPSGRPTGSTVALDL